MTALKGTDGNLAKIQSLAKFRLSPLTVALIVLLASCGSPSDSSPVKVIGGAKLDPGHDSPRLEHSVIVIRDGKFQAVGPQQSTPVPKGAQMISGMGKLVTPAPSSGLIAPGQPADLVLRDAATNSAEMVMHDGEWLK
jgi:hypothetical protein